MIKNEELRTTPTQRIVIILIAIFLLGSTFALYAGIVLSYKNQDILNASNEEKSQRFSELYAEYQAKVDEHYVRETLPDYVDSDFETLDEKIIEVLGQYAEGDLNADDAVTVAEDMLYTTDSIKNGLKLNILHSIESQDAALATALKYFDNSFLTLTFDDGTEISEEQKEYLSGVTGVSLGSDAFFPFDDNIERAFRSGVKYVAEPGGSIRDDLVIAKCDEHEMVMAFTGMRLFHH